MEHFQRKAGGSDKQIHLDKKEDFKIKITDNLINCETLSIANIIESV